MKQVVIMPGGFHPFHAGHAALYQSARQAFPGADVYVAATDDTSTRPFPFQVKEKLAQLAGVDKGRFMRVKSPFQATEITAPYNAADTQLIFVRSEKDATKPPQAGGIKKNGEPSYLQPYNKNSTAPMSQHGYMAYLPTVEFGPGMTSATEIRAAWPQLNEKRKTALVMSLYPKTQGNPKLAANVVQMLDTAIGAEVAENQGWAATYESDGLTAGTGVTGGMHASYQDRYNQPVDEARIHLTDPKTPVNLYYITPKLQAQGKVQNVAHNIPYSTVQPLINRLMQKYSNMNPEYMVWYPLGQDQYGQRLSERDITSKLGTKRDRGKSVRKWRKQRGLDEQQLSKNISVKPNQDPNSFEDWDYYYKDVKVAPGQDFHTQIKDQHLRQIDPEYDTMRNAFDNPIRPGPVVPQNQSGDTVIPARPKPPQPIKDLHGQPIRLKDFVAHDPDILEDYLEEERTDPIEAAAIDFYQNKVGNVRPEPVQDYREIARELLGKTEDPSMREKIMHILVQGNKNPYIQGGIITTVAAIVSGGILTSAARMGLTPQQTNMMLQAVLNTVVPTVVSRLNGKSWRDTAKYTLASAGIGTGIAAMTETGRKK